MVHHFAAMVDVKFFEILTAAPFDQADFVACSKVVTKIPFIFCSNEVFHFCWYG